MPPSLKFRAEGVQKSRGYSICRERCLREGWTVVSDYGDAAISGAAGIGAHARPGLNALLEHVKRGGIDQILCEATDRISRHTGNFHSVRERLAFRDTRLFTLSDGEVSDGAAALRGYMDAQFRKDLGAKIKRGQRGSIADSRAPTGLAFGYRIANVLAENGRHIRGLREIDSERAEIVRFIFAEYAFGRSPREIAEHLNARGIAAPSGGKWRASTIGGDLKRQNGMLQNQIYIGRLVHNRTSRRTDPDTRKTLIRPNPESEWIVQEVPGLRIIDQAVWDAVQAIRQRNKGKPYHRLVRPKHLLSGLGQCGVCGGGWSMLSRDRWGCSLFREGGRHACSNNRTITNAEYIRRVLGGLHDRLLDPDLVETYVAEFKREVGRRNRELTRSLDDLCKRHRDTNGSSMYSHQEPTSSPRLKDS